MAGHLEKAETHLERPRTPGELTIFLQHRRRNTMSEQNMLATAAEVVGMVVAAEAEVQLLRRQARAAQESSEAMQLTCIQRERGREEAAEAHERQHQRLLHLQATLEGEQQQLLGEQQTVLLLRRQVKQQQLEAQEMSVHSERLVSTIALHQESLAQYQAEATAARTRIEQLLQLLQLRETEAREAAREASS